MQKQDSMPNPLTRLKPTYKAVAKLDGDRLDDLIRQTMALIKSGFELGFDRKQIVNLNKTAVLCAFRWYKLNPVQTKTQAGSKGGRGKKKQGDQSPSFSKDTIKKIRRVFKGKTLADVEGFFFECDKKGDIPSLHNFSKGGFLHGPSVQRYGTPPEIAQAVRAVLGHIDLDPASEKKANQVIKAIRFFSEKDDGLKQDWVCNVFLNPPFKKSKDWVKKLLSEFEIGRVKRAILVVPSSTGEWEQDLLSNTLFKGVCFIKGKVRFKNLETGITDERGNPVPILVFALGDIDFENFRNSFKGLGKCLKGLDLSRHYYQFLYLRQKQKAEKLSLFTQAMLKDLQKRIQTQSK